MERGAGRQFRLRISKEARLDLKWWNSLLALAPERSIQKIKRHNIYLWSDASRTKGPGAYFTTADRARTEVGTSQGSSIAVSHPIPGAAFSISLPRFINRNNEHINTKEMRAVEQALLHWGKSCRGVKVIMHIDNRAVAYAITNQTIRGATRSVLRHCLLLAAKYDLEIETQWIATKDNSLADALSRFDFDKITNLTPQLLLPTSTLRDRGFLIYNRQASRP